MTRAMTSERLCYTLWTWWTTPTFALHYWKKIGQKIGAIRVGQWAEKNNP